MPLLHGASMSSCNYYHRNHKPTFDPRDVGLWSSRLEGPYHFKIHRYSIKPHRTVLIMHPCGLYHPHLTINKQLQSRLIIGRVTGIQVRLRCGIVDIKSLFNRAKSKIPPIHDLDTFSATTFHAPRPK
jgi:hypothetical protein